jgi:CubicO group peptidase (beta-lactamase class C family)
MMKRRNTKSKKLGKIFIICTLFVEFLYPLSLQAQMKAEELDRLFTFYNQHSMFNGAVLAAEKGEVIYEKAFGFADFEKKIALTKSSIFSIGSITKPFTAAAVMILKEKGVLKYTDPIVKFFPQFPPYAKDITIHHLLTHTSGLIDYLGRGLELLRKFPEVSDSLVFDNLASQTSLQFKPGEEFQYSNSNYVLLARIIENVSKKTYGDFIKENILIPLRMNQTFVYEGSEEALERSVKSYVNYWEEDKENFRLKTKGDGNIYSTPGDLFKFAEGLFSQRLVGKETLEEAFEDSAFKYRNEKKKSKYGFGWEIINSSAGKIVYHRGKIAGFCCELWQNLETDSTLIVLCNTLSLVENPPILDGAENIMEGQSYSQGKISAARLFWDNWYVKGFDAGWYELKKATSAEESDCYYIHPWEIHAIGYSCQKRGEKESALKVFKYSIELFPENFNLLDSLGEAYLALGDKQNAIKYYKEALEINPECESSIKALKKLGEIK